MNVMYKPEKKKNDGLIVLSIYHNGSINEENTRNTAKTLYFAFYRTSKKNNSNSKFVLG